ncbi:protein of unknown function [Denitratisoma oestradiolicum]|uniref:Uncharacterized protein n=1 Tax=Denitratisoma oestradiolicum TaxID=311182 RepID=A0A6S6Y194_9PROT|nr:protein of unknown function [Denitratisoma oestradiolicum]
MLSLAGITFHVALLTAFWVAALAPLSVLGHSKSREPPEMRTLRSHFSHKLRPSVATITMSQNGV